MGPIRKSGRRIISSGASGPTLAKTSLFQSGTVARSPPASRTRRLSATAALKSACFTLPPLDSLANTLHSRAKATCQQRQVRVRHPNLRCFCLQTCVLNVVPS